MVMTIEELGDRSQSVGIARKIPGYSDIPTQHFTIPSAFVSSDGRVTKHPVFVQKRTEPVVPRRVNQTRSVSAEY